MAEKKNPGALAGATGAGMPCHATAAGTLKIASCARKCDCADRLDRIAGRLQAVIDDLRTLEILIDLHCQAGGDDG